MPEPFDVAIVGLGPVGAALAAGLAMRGARVVVLERSTAPHAQPRAAHLDDDALRVLQGVGALSPVLAAGRPLDGFDLVRPTGETLLRARKRVAWSMSLPPALLVHQPDVEDALRARLDELGVEVRLGIEVVAIAQDADGVTLASAAGAPVRARYAVGCDGARSRVREAMGVALEGGRFEERWLVIDARVPPRADLPERLLQIADADQPATYVPFPGRRRRWEFRLAPAEAAEGARQPDAVRARLRPFLAPAGVDPAAVAIERAAVYTFHDLVAARWRRGRILLAGDAAHQMPPFLGQGLGAGLRDVATLGWMLPLVARGIASPSLLDVYQAERRPHVETTTRLAVRLGRLISASGAAARVRDLGLRAAHRAGLADRLRSIEAPLPRVRPQLATSGRLPRDPRLPQPRASGAGHVRRLDDALGRGFAVLGIGLDARRWAGGDAVWRQLDTAFLTLDADAWEPAGELARWAGRAACAVVVRPDRIALGVYRPDGAARAAGDLEAALRSQRPPRRRRIWRLRGPG